MLGMRKVIVALGVLLLMSAATAYAEEQRCKDLGANCICSEPMNTNSIVNFGPLDGACEGGHCGFNPADSVTKECAASGLPGAAVTRTRLDVFGSNDASVKAALPGGHSITYFLRAAEGHVNIYWIGTTLGAQYTKRVAIRLYVYYSPNFEFAYTNACQNHKHWEATSIVSTLGGTDGAGNFGGEHNFYSWNNPGFGWNHAPDCCFQGPNSVNDFGQVPASSRRGKWFRTEFIITNRAGGSSPNGLRAQVYEKNVTDNTAERLVLDTAGPFANPPWGNWTDLTPRQRQDFIAFAGYRQNVCAGYYGFLHLMAAGWDTDAGQRIGAASEIEGGSGDTTQPAPPTSLSVQ